MPLAATRLDRRTSIGFPCTRFYEGSIYRLPSEHTLSLNALFAPEVDGRGALGAGADAFEAIFTEVERVNYLLVLRTQRFARRDGIGRPDVCRNSRER
jgi:hypothetical protein